MDIYGNIYKHMKQNETYRKYVNKWEYIDIAVNI